MISTGIARDFHTELLARWKSLISKGAARVAKILIYAQHEHGQARMCRTLVIQFA
jgi:hypothetical protein